jgi:type I restriction enzyme S subunit
VKADCIRFKPGDNVLPKYLMYALNAAQTRRVAKARLHGVGRPRLNLGEIKSIVVPVPPLSTQRLIVAEADRRLSMADEMEAQADASLRRADGLRQAILKRAFEGKLG